MVEVRPTLLKYSPKNLISDNMWFRAGAKKTPPGLKGHHHGVKRAPLVVKGLKKALNVVVKDWSHQRGLRKGAHSLEMNLLKVTSKKGREIVGRWHRENGSQVTVTAITSGFITTYTFIRSKLYRPLISNVSVFTQIGTNTHGQTTLKTIPQINLRYFS